SDVCSSDLCKKLNVLAGAISSLKSDKSDNVAFWVPKTFVPKSTIAVTSYLSDGIMMISEPVRSSTYLMTSFTTYTSLSASCSITPAVSTASTKNFDEPSMIGGSEAFNSIITLSKSLPTNAANTCSVV